VIAQVRGLVLEVGHQSAVVEAGGVGYLATCTPGALGRLRVGEEATLTTLLQVRDDGLTLYGFKDPGEREVFQAVQTVTGIGPRIALAVLSAMTPDQFRAAVASGDVAAIQRVPGIGKKGAQRMVLELAGRLDPPAGAVAGPSGGAVAEEVTAALVGLGYTQSQAASAVDGVMAQDSAGDVPGVLRAALRALGTKGSAHGR
jgi:Holliday junction DNA helicase RuvA